MEAQSIIDAVTAVPRVAKETYQSLVQWWWGEPKPPCLCKEECKCKKKKRWRVILQ